MPEFSSLLTFCALALTFTGDSTILPVLGSLNAQVPIFVIFLVGVIVSLLGVFCFMVLLGDFVAEDFVGVFSSAFLLGVFTGVFVGELSAPFSALALIFFIS